MIGPLIILMIFVVVLGFGFWRKLTHSYSWRRVMLFVSISLIGVMLGFLPIAQASSEEVAGSTDVLFIVDLTYSMNARDATYRGRQLSRLEQASAHIQDISSGLVGSRVAIMALDNLATLYLPFTTSERDVRLAAETMFTKTSSQSVIAPQLSNGLDEARDYLQRQRDVDDTRRQIVIFMTDGELNSEEDTDESLRSAFEQLNADVQGSLIIGYGTTDGAPIPEVRFDFETLEVESSGFNVYDPEAKGDAISQLNESLLSELGAFDRSSFRVANDSPDVAADAVALRQAAGNVALNNGTTRALNQNVLHVPFAIGSLVLVSALEVWREPRLRKLLAHIGRRT